MFKISRRTTFGMLLLLIMPVAVWLSGWRWQPGESNALLKGLFWMTETSPTPGALLPASC